MSQAPSYAVLGSGRGSTLERLCTLCDETNDIYKPTRVFAASPQLGLQAQKLGLKCDPLNPDQPHEPQISALLQRHRIELLILVGYMRILSAAFCRAFAGRIVNIHPSLLPRYQGMRDLAIHQAVIHNQDPTSGCTLHWVTTHVDAGGILLQMPTVVTTTDAHTLKSQIQQLEAQALLQCIQNWNALKNTPLA